MREHRSKSARATHIGAHPFEESADQKMKRFADRPQWLENAIYESLKRRNHLAFLESQLDELEERIRFEEQRSHMLFSLVLSSPVVCCFILITVWFIYS